jgi:hypothetical protein
MLGVECWTCPQRFAQRCGRVLRRSRLFITRQVPGRSQNARMRSGPTLSKNSVWIFMPVFLVLVASAGAGDLRQNYFGGTTPGAWSEYVLTSPDGSKSEYSYEREADADGRAVLAVQVKIIAGPGKDTTSKTNYILPKDFSFEREGLNYGRFAEKMTMVYGGTEMVVDAKTLETIRQGTKNFAGALAFEASESVDGRLCDRYGYGIKIGGPNPTQETGKLWMNPAVPFGIVRQEARMTDLQGKLVTEFDMRLTNVGLNQGLAAAAVPPAPPASPKPPVATDVGLADGFKAGRVGIDLEVVAGSAGHKLRVTLVNKTEGKLTVNVPAGDVQIEADSPVNTLKIAGSKAIKVVVPPSEKADPFEVEQRAGRGVVEGHCSLSVYEGTPLFSGSVTMGPLK